MNKQSKSRMPERINVGVWIHIRHWEQSLCENGIFQSCLHLVTVLMRSPRVKSPYVVTGGSIERRFFAFELACASSVQNVRLIHVSLNSNSPAKRVAYK
jgi:hypothetical protein